MTMTQRPLSKSLAANSYAIPLTGARKCWKWAFSFLHFSCDRVGKKVAKIGQTQPMQCFADSKWNSRFRETNVFHFYCCAISYIFYCYFEENLNRFVKNQTTISRNKLNCGRKWDCYWFSSLNKQILGELYIDLLALRRLTCFSSHSR